MTPDRSRIWLTWATPLAAGSHWLSSTVAPRALGVAWLEQGFGRPGAAVELMFLGPKREWPESITHRRGASHLCAQGGPV